MAAELAGTGVRTPEFMFTAACTTLILPSGIAGCRQPLQPDPGLAGIKGVHNAHSEYSIMDSGDIAVFIPIVAIVMGIGIGMLSIWSEHKRKAQLLEQNHRERMHAIEKGIELPPLPPNLVGISNGPSTASAAKSLRSGIMLVLIGILLYFAIEVSGGHEGALFGLIPAAVGVANLVYAWIQWDKEKSGSRNVERP
jgi:hypothetical protein